MQEKNRTGIYMEKYVERIFKQNDIPYTHQYKAQNIDLGDDLKQFDFMIKTLNKTYLIEVNFYNTSGSKLNEVARSYGQIGEKINRQEGYEFVWITDGQGWLSSQNMIQETFNKINRIYNIHTLKNFIEDIKKEL